MNINNKKLLFILFIISLLLSACGKSRQTHVCFFYWQQNFTLSSGQLQYLKDLNTHTLYIKFFDVDWDETVKDAVPLAKIHFETGLPADIDIIPCVFITNRAMEKIAAHDIPLMAQRIVTLLQTLGNTYNINHLSEFQVDCDWTLSTKQKYFALLKQIK